MGRLAAPHRGESFVQLISRVGQSMERQANAGHILAVTHRAVIRAAMLSAIKAPPQSFWRIEIGLSR